MAEAMIRPVSPSLFFLFTSALLSTSSSHIDWKPLVQAMCKAVAPDRPCILKEL